MYQQPPNPNQNVPMYTPPQQPYSQYPQPPPQGYSAYPPPPYPQYNQPPSMPPKRKRRVWLWIVGILVVLFIFGKISAIGSHGGTTTSTPPAATQAPTTALPTDTPTPTPLTNKDAITKQVQADIAAAALTGDIIQADYGEKGNAFALVGLKPPLTLSSSEQLTLVQNDCFDGQKAIWTDPLLQTIGSMEVYVFTQDSIGAPVAVGDCTLHPQTASLIDWNNTDAVTAWNNKVYEGMTP